MAVIKDPHVPSPKDKGNPSGGREESGIDLKKELKDALDRESVVAYIERIRGGGQSGDPATVAAQMVQAAGTISGAARDLSKDERADRFRAEERAEGAIARIDQARRDAEDRFREAEGKAEKERAERLQDLLAFQVSEMRRIETTIKEATSKGKESTVGEEIGRFAEGIKAMREVIVELTPESGKKPATELEGIAASLQQLNEIRKLFVSEKAETPMVSMKDLANQLPAPFAIELKKIELEDARMRDQAKDQIALEERKRQTSESIIGLLMGIGTSVMEAFSGSVPETGGYPAVGQGATGGHGEPASAPSFIEVSCPDCGKSFYVRPETAKGPLQCPFCATSK